MSEHAECLSCRGVLEVTEVQLQNLSPACRSCGGIFRLKDSIEPGDIVRLKRFGGPNMLVTDVEGISYGDCYLGDTDYAYVLWFNTMGSQMNTKFKVSFLEKVSGSI